MIRNSFSILNGIGEKLERRLWSEGILTWKDFMEAGTVEFISGARKENYDEHLSVHLDRLHRGDARHFRDALRGNEHWRLFEVFRDGAVCLDIETNGYPAGMGGYVTMVGLYDGCDYKSFVRGENLSTESLMRELSHYRYLITFFGSAFDVPFLSNAMEGFSLDIPHFDICFGARKVGLGGGLKKLEAELGIERALETRGMDGYDAVLLWNEVRRGSSEAIELLVKYNREDTVNLWSISETVYERLRDATGIDRYLN